MGACSTCRASASSSGRPRCSPACRRLHRARRAGHRLLPHPGRCRARAARPARGAAVRHAHAAGPRAPRARRRRSLRGGGGSRAPARRRAHAQGADPLPAADEHSRRGAADDRLGRHLGRRRPRRLAWDPHRSRPAHARGGRRAVPRRARLRGDDGAGLYRGGRSAGQRGVAGHARSRRAPLPRPLGDRRGARRRGGSRPRRRGDADVVSPAGRDRSCVDDGRARRGGARPAPDDRRTASRANGAAARRRRPVRGRRRAHPAPDRAHGGRCRRATDAVRVARPRQPGAARGAPWLRRRQRGGVARGGRRSRDPRVRAGGRPPRRRGARRAAACVSIRRAPRPPTRWLSARFSPGAGLRRAGSRTPRRSRR